MEPAVIFFLFVLFFIVLSCIRQLEGVSNYIKDQPRSFFWSSFFMVNLVCTPLWISAIDSGKYLTIIILNIVFIPMILFYSLGGDLFDLYLNYLQKKEEEEEWQERIDERRPGSTQDSFNYEDGSGNIDGDSSSEEAGNTETSSEQSAFSKTTNNSNVTFNNQSELNEKSKDKDIKHLGFDKKEERIKSRAKSEDLQVEK